jgi:hypothetical protein
MEVPAVTYEYLFCPPSSDRLRPLAQSRPWRLLSGSCTLGTVGHRLRPKILETTGSLQWQTAEEPYTSCRIWPHHSRLKRREHQPKKTNPGSNPRLHFSTLQWVWASRILPPVCLFHLPPRPRARLGPPVKRAQGLLATDKHCQHRGLGKW